MLRHPAAAKRNNNKNNNNNKTKPKKERKKERNRADFHTLEPWRSTAAEPPASAGAAAPRASAVPRMFRRPFFALFLPQRLRWFRLLFVRQTGPVRLPGAHDFASFVSSLPKSSAQCVCSPVASALIRTTCASLARFFFSKYHPNIFYF